MSLRQPQPLATRLASLPAMRVLFSLAALVSVAYADITFNVVGYPSTTTGTFGVSVGGQIIKLATNETTFPVWTGTVPGSTAATEYAYVELNAAGAAVKTEAFKRKLSDPAATATPNEFFERQTTAWNLPRVPYTYLATYPSNTKAFRPDQIATFHITAPVALITSLFANPMDAPKGKADVRFISNDTIHSQTNVTFGLSGKSSREHTKQAFKLKFDTDIGQKFFHRPNIKLRSMVMDPTLIREMLYIDMLNSAGIPTQQGAWVRVFINNEPYGLYLMVDDISGSFLKQTVHGGDAKVGNGSLVQMNAFPENGQQYNADLVYKGPSYANYNKGNYDPKKLGPGDTEAEPIKELLAFMKDLQDFDPASTPDPVAYWEQRMDLDGVLRCMALEYLGGAFDNYWLSASNYFMYKNPTLSPTGKWQWIPTDFDGTFGNGNPYSTLVSYKSWYDNKLGPRPLVSKLILNNTALNAKFEQILKELVSTAIKGEALVPRIDAYHNMLAEDAKWEYSIQRKGPGIARKFTLVDFNDNLDKQTEGMSYSLRGWVRDMGTFVANELKFTIPAGLADRVAPPPRKKKGDDGEPNEDGAPKDGKSAGTRPSSWSGATAAAVLAVVSTAMLMA
ncbi:hypothetical protein EC968_001832 [Mortierella alpina]|nr:hypothetical protein EC968_001832 [Mortierella alpina]